MSLDTDQKFVLSVLAIVFVLITVANTVQIYQLRQTSVTEQDLEAVKHDIEHQIDDMTKQRFTEDMDKFRSFNNETLITYSQYRASQLNIGCIFNPGGWTVDYKDAELQLYDNNNYWKKGSQSNLIYINQTTFEFYTLDHKDDGSVNFQKLTAEEFCERT